MGFSQLIGNELAKSALMRMVEQNTLPHTLLFYGPEGVGKSLFALKLTELLMGPSAHAKLASGNHPDLHFLHPEGKAGIHPVENMRSLIKEAALPPFEAPVKVFIIHDAHQMLAASSNALLKTLEEPTPRTFFILLTSQLEAILPTIISRSRKISFFPIPDKEIELFVQTEWKKEPEEAKRIAFLSHGSLAKAHMLIAPEKKESSSLVHSLVHLRLPQEYAQLLSLCDALEKEEEENASAQDALLEEIFAQYRDLHLLNSGINCTYLYNSRATSRKAPSLEVVLEELLNVRTALQRHTKLRVALEQFFLKMEHACVNCP